MNPRGTAVNGKMGLMEELQLGSGDFAVKGAVRTFKASIVSPSTPTLSNVQAGFDRSGHRSLNVRPGGDSGYPHFTFRLLTLEFMAAVIDNRKMSFSFSLTHEAIGHVTYVSGAAARDYGWQLGQSILSVHGSGQSCFEGLSMELHGDLADPDPRDGDPMPDLYRHASYGVQLEIPWRTMRFLFGDYADLVQSKYQDANRVQS